MNEKGISLVQLRQRKTRQTAALFLAPVIILLVVFIAYPIIDTFITSGYQWNGISADKKMVGLANWAKLIKDTKFWIAFKNNVIIMILSIIIQIPLGLAMATFLDFGGKKLTIFKVIWFIPMLMSSVAIGFLFTYALATNGGIVSTISGWFGGGNIDLLGNPKLALLTVILIIAWQFTPFYMVYFMAGYTNIPYDVFEAARIDGATRGQYFWKIALPLLIPSIKSAAILSMVGSLKYFDLIYVMTGGGPGTATELMATYMYKESFKNFNMGYGSAIAGGMFILITMVSMITMKLINGKQERAFRHEIRKLADKPVNFAFVPMDPRLGPYQTLGIDFVLKNTDAEFVFPMHMWQDYSAIREYKKHITNLGMADRVIEIERENQVFPFGEL